MFWEKRSRPMVKKKKKKKKIQVKGENNMTRQKKITTSHYSQNIMIKILLSNRLYISI